MTQCQRDNLYEILAAFLAEMPLKYERGAQVHDEGCLSDCTPLVLCEYALEEALDQVAYLVTLRQKLRRIE